MKSIEQSFGILGLKPEATAEEVKRAYYDLVREWHPDKHQQDSRRVHLAEEKLKEINVAYARVCEWEAGGRPSAPQRPAQRPYAWRTPNGTSRTQAYRSYAGATQETEEPRESGFTRAAALHQQGMEHFRYGRLREAVSSLVQSVCINPNNPEAHITLGSAYRLQNNPAKAAAAFKQAVRFRASSSEAHSQLGQSYIDMGELKEAVWTCSQFLRKHPDSPDVYVTLASAYRRQGRLPQAMEAVQQALRVSPEMPAAHYEAGMAHLGAGEKELARQKYETLRGMDQDLAVKLLLAILDR
jgi:tetratricopeptide (TPR) repeat protein